MICYRIAKSKHSASPQDMLSGEGARVYGGRWNPSGVPAIYASENLSLATLEVLVHAQRAKVLPQYRYLRINVDDNALTVLDPVLIADQAEENVGAEYLQQHLGFVVPSAVMSVENNVVLNPMHPDWNAAVGYGDVSALPIDERLLLRNTES